jgi:hypothetical protein
MDRIKKLVKEIISEKKIKRDRCLRIADRKFDKPSAYKSGAVVRCRAGKIWKDIKEETTYHEINESQKYNQDSIEQIFKNTPQLSDIGTIEQYTKYLETIFPNSKLKGIVYHGGTLNSKDRGKDSFTGEYGGKYGIYFTGSPGRAKNYIKGGNDDYKSRSKVYFALLNIERPLDKKVWSKWKYNADTITDEGFKQMKDNNADGIIVTDLLSKINVTQYGTQYVVLDMDQVHILGSEQDINMFKKYVNKNIFEELITEKLKENNNSDDYLKKVGIELYNYIPHSFPPDLTSLNKQEYEVVINDLRKEKMGLVDYLQFVNSMSGDPVYKSILLKLVKGNKNKIEFTLDQNEMIKYEGLNKLQKFKNFYEKYKDSFPNWASENKRLYDDVINALKSSLNEAEKETLRTWFKRKGAPGKTGGWVDCNAPIRKDGKIVGYKPCGRQKGEKRAYPACRPTPAKCKAPGKGKKWGKKSK